MGVAEYSEAAVEVLDILNNTYREYVEKIPESFIKFLMDISNKEYKPQFNHEQQISELNLRDKTRELLGFIYITWWSNDEEREEYKKQIQEVNKKEEVIQESYNVNDIFKNRKENHEQSLIEYKKENIFKKVLNKILSFFGRKNEER